MHLPEGGTAGHVFPAFPVIERLKRADYDVFWIGSTGGMERSLVEQAGLPYIAVSAGKFRRYWSWKNITDLLRILRGFIQSLMILRRRRPAALFSKGGFVSVPPVAAARFLGIPSFTHESDVDPGLATRLNTRLGARLLVANKETLGFLPSSVRAKALVVGNPVRDTVFQGNRIEGRRIAALPPDDKRPLLLVLGGSQGAQEINDLILGGLDELLTFLAVVHQRGAGNPGLPDRPGYLSREFFNEELPHILAAADLAVSRSGAGAVWELAASATPAVFIPLRTATRGDQVINARMTEKIGFSVTLEKDSAPGDLIRIIKDLLADEAGLRSMKEAAGKLAAGESADNIAAVIEGQAI